MKACLGAVVVAALRNPFLQITQITFYWRTNKIEFVNNILA